MDNGNLEEQLFADIGKVIEEKEGATTDENSSLNDETQQQQQNEEVNKEDSSVEVEQTEQQDEAQVEEVQKETQNEAEQSQEQTPAPEQTQTEEKDEQKTEPAESTFDPLEYYKENRDNIDLALRDLDSVDLTDVDTVADLLVERYENDGYTSDEAIRLLEKRFPTMFSDEDIDEDDPDVQKALDLEFIEMKSDGRKFVSELKERQSKIDLSNVGALTTGNSSADSVIEQYQQEMQKQQQEYVEKLQTQRAEIAKDVLNDVKELEIDLGDGNVVKYKLEEEDSAAFSKDILTIENFFTQFQKEDGSLDKQSLLLSYLAAKNPQKLGKVIGGYYKGKGYEEAVKNDFKNNTMKPKGKSSDGTNRTLAGDDVQTQIARAIKDGKIDPKDFF